VLNRDTPGKTAETGKSFILTVGYRQAHKRRNILEGGAALSGERRGDGDGWGLFANDQGGQGSMARVEPLVKVGLPPGATRSGTTPPQRHLAARCIG